MKKERTIRAVPKGVILVLFILLVVQISTRALSPLAAPSPSDLTGLPNNKIIQSAFLGDGVLAGRLLMLWLQARDTQTGALMANNQRDYRRLSQWLMQLSELDPRSHYPLLLAGRVYSQTSSPQRIRIMLDTVNNLFKRSPKQFWRWQAEAAVLAKHRLQDQSLALEYAQSLAELTPPKLLPYWARDMQFVLLQDLGKKQELELLVGGLLASGQVREEKEIEWLSQQLEAAGG